MVRKPFPSVFAVILTSCAGRNGEGEAADQKSCDTYSAASSSAESRSRFGVHESDICASSYLTLVKKATYEAGKKKTVGVDDLCLLSKISNEAINDNLRIRFENREIYVR